MKRAFLGAVFAAAPTAAFAHPAAFDHVHGFVEGATHPFLGADHVLAMVAVGLLAARYRGRAAWAVPLAFMGMMAVGGAAGVAGVSVPFVEPAIALSVLVLGLGLVFSERLTAWAAAAAAGFFAVFHGLAHGAEIPETASGLLYAAGFLGATGLLHLAGFGLGRIAGNAAAGRSGALFRIAGGLFAAAGVVLIAAAG